MGLDAHAYTYLGIQVEREAFLTVTGTKNICERDHQVDCDFEFCPKDGTQTTKQDILSPTDAFRVYARLKGKGAMELWNEWMFGAPALDSPQVFRASSAQGSASKGSSYGFGYLLKRASSFDYYSNNDAPPRAVGLDELTRMGETLRSEAETLLIRGPIKLFTVLYLSH